MDKRKCDYCCEEIQISEKRCPYCASLLGQPRKESGNMGSTGVEESHIHHSLVDENYIPDFVLQYNEQSSEPEDGKNNPIRLKAENTDYEKFIGQADDNVYRHTGCNSPLGCSVPAKSSLSNGFKVFLTAFSTLIPGLGQLVGLIAAIVFMNSNEDDDKKSFGLALMITSLVVFAITFLFYTMLGMVLVSFGI